MKKVFWWIGGILLSPILLFLILTILLYLPPVQNWAVQKVTAIASEKTGYDISVDHVCLAFPLDLQIDGFRMIAPPDTVADVERLIVDVQLMPLFSSKVVINQLEMTAAKVNTVDLVEAARVKGEVGRLYAESRGIDLDRETVDLNNAQIECVRLDVALSDSVPPDTSTTKTLWKIYADSLTLSRADVTLHMPGDSMTVKAVIDLAKVYTGVVDLENELYSVGSVEWKGGRAEYHQNYAPRAEGLDFNHLVLSDIQIGIDSVFFQSPVTRLSVRHASMKEQSGLELSELSGPVAMDSLTVSLPRLHLRTPDSDLYTELDMDMNAFDDEHPGRLFLRLNASVGKQDIVRFAGNLPQKAIERWPNAPLTLRGSVNGNMQHCDFTGLDISLPSAFHATASGWAENLTDTKRLKADVTLAAETGDLSFVTAMLDPQLMRQYRIPRGITLDGRFKADGEQYDADFTAREGGGVVKAKALFNAAAMSYRANVNIKNLNLHHFMPRDSLYTLTAHVSAQGRGTDFLSRSTWAQADAEVEHLRYGSWNLSRLQAHADVKNGRAQARIDSRNKLADGTVDIDALLSTERLDATIGADLRHVDLYRLRVTEAPMSMSMCSHLDVESNLKDYYKLQGLINDLTIRDSLQTHRPTDITIDALTRRDTTWAKAYRGNLELNLAARGGYEKLIGQLTKLTDELAKQWEQRVIDQPRLVAMLPSMRLHLLSGNDNPVVEYLAMSGVTFKDLSFDLATSPESGLNGQGHLYSLVTDSMRIDTVTFRVSTKDSTKTISFGGLVQNNKRNPQFVFKALFDGVLREHGAVVGVRYYDADNRLGARVGAEAELLENGINLHLVPSRPTLGYKEFNLNKDNYIFLGPNNRLSAKVDLVADDGTGVKLYTEDENEEMLQDLTLSLNKINLDEITSVLPYVPRMGGMLSGDYHVMQDKDKRISMSSDMSVTGMSYERSPIGNIGTEFVYMQRGEDAHWVEAHLTKDDREVGLLTGSYRDEGDGWLDAKFDMKRLPLSMVNGFIPDQLFGFEGYGEGSLDIKGSLSAPQVNGEVYLDSSYLVSIPYGMTLRFDNDPVRIVGSNLLLENFTVYAHNDNPLNVQGSVDFSNPDRMMVNLRMRTQNYGIINSKENAKSVAFGKAFVNFFGTMSGPVDNLSMRGRLEVLGSTDVSYILRDSPLSTDNQLKDLVKFVDFTDTTQTVIDRPQLTGFNMDLTMDVSKGAHVMAYLNADKTNYIDLMGGGTLRLKYNTRDNLQLTGRYTLSNGEMKYSLPVIPLKTFTIQDGSYIEFSGDPMNPRLNITATERTKATVTGSNGVGRSVDFDCGLKITKTLNDMGLEFTLDAPEDMALSSELQSMSLEQRGKLAVSMLTTGMYLADGNTSSFSMNSALSSFLNSEINNITGNALRTLDLSFGMDNSTDATGQEHTDYSFKFAKRFWNNRVKVTVGGKVSSGAQMPNQNQSFFDNVSLEYRLDDTANKYLTLFFNNNTYDWLEGYMQKYGGGFTWRRTLQSFWDIFSLKNNKQQMPMAPRETARTLQAPRDSIKTSNEERKDEKR